MEMRGQEDDKIWEYEHIYSAKPAIKLTLSA